IRRRFAAAGRVMPEENRRQAYLLRGADAIDNRAGTAPGQILRRGGKSLILLPGPPNELIPMLETAVCPHLRRHYPSSYAETIVLHVYGFPESEVDERIAPVVEKKRKIPGVKIVFGILAHRAIIDVKVTAEASRPSAVRTALAVIRRELLDLLGGDVYGEGPDTLQSVAGR